MEWADPDPLEPNYIGYYTGPGSGGGSWRFYKAQGVPQQSMAITVVFSYQLKKDPVVNEPCTIVINGANLPIKGDKLKVVAGLEAIHGSPVAGSKVVRNLIGTSFSKTARVTFDHPIQRELIVVYDAGLGDYQPVRPDRSNRAILLVQPQPFKVDHASERLLKVRKDREPRPLDKGWKMTQGQQANMVERLYTQSLEHDQRKWEKLASDLAQPLSRKFRKLASAEDEEEWIKRMFYAKTEMSAQAARKLSMKYAADPVPVLKLRDYSEIEEANDKFFYRRQATKLQNRKRLLTKYLGKEEAERYTALEGPAVESEASS